MYQNGYEQYKMQSVNTMTKGEMLLLLYDELLKRLTKAQLALNEEMYEVFDQSVIRASEIVQYLKHTLDMKYTVSSDLSKLYDFFIYELSRLQASRNDAVIDELKPLVADLREAFQEANKATGGM